MICAFTVQQPQPQPLLPQPLSQPQLLPQPQPLLPQLPESSRMMMRMIIQQLPPPKQEF